MSNQGSLLILLALILIATSFILVSRETKVSIPPPFQGVVPVHGATTITAGNTAIITVGPVAVQDGVEATLIAEGSYGIRVYQAKLHSGETQFVLRGTDTQQSGVVHLTAVVGQGQGTAHMLIQPAAPVEPLTPLVGAKAIVADADHWSMTVLVPFDAYGNPVMEGTRVEVLVMHPGNRLETKFLEVQHLLAWTRVFSGTKAGRTTIVARIGQVHGFEGTLLEVAGWPVPFDISADPQPLPANGNLLTTLHTATIVDAFGNPMPDGTEITFVVRAPDGSYSTIPAYTIDGQAQVAMQAPLLPGDYQVQATVLGVTSHPTLVHFTAGPVINAFPVSLQKDAINNGYRLQAGPMLGSLGQYIPDSTPIRFVVANASGQSQELDSISDAGYASVELLAGQFPAGNYTVRVIVGSEQVTQRIRLG